MLEFYRLAQKATDYSTAVLLTAKNEKFFLKFIDLLFLQMKSGIDQTAAKVVLVILKQLVVQLNGFDHQHINFMAKR